MGEVLNRILSNISDVFDKSVGSFFYDVSKPMAEELDAINEKLEQILTQGFALTAKGEYLDRKVAEQGITRKAATFAHGIVTLSGISGSIILVGSKVASDNVVFSIVEEVTIGEGGSVDADILCDTAGTIGNVPIGSIKSFPVTLTGITAVTNTTATSGGYDAETDDELRVRYFEKVSTPATSGNKQDYVNWAKEMSGVGDVKVLPLWDGAGTVKVIIINSAKCAASAELISDVAEYIESKRPVGADITVESAVPLAINVSATLVLASTSSVEAVTPSVSIAIENYIKQVAFEQDYISYAKIGGAILSVSGVLDYTDLTINGGILNVAVDENEVPVMGVITLA